MGFARYVSVMKWDNEITEVQTLDNLFLKEMITPEEYIESMPINLLPSKNLLLHKIKQRMMQQNQMPPMQQEQMTPQSEMPPADMSEPVSEITPTPEDLAGLVEPNRVSAVAGRAAAANEE